MKPTVYVNPDYLRKENQDPSNSATLEGSTKINIKLLLPVYHFTMV